MEFKSNRRNAIIVAVICAFIGVSVLVLAITFDDPGAPQGTQALFGLLGIVLIIGSSALLTFRLWLRIDGRKLLVECNMSALFWSQTKRFHITSFQEVSITTLKGQAGHSYVVVLRGPKTISIPGTGSGGYDTILSRARKVAELTGLPLNET